MRKMYALLVFAAAGLVVSAGGLAFLWFRGREAPAPASNPYAELQVLEFDLVNEQGEPVDEAVFEDQVTVLTFIFTRCPLVCPGMTFAVQDVQRRLDGSGVRFVSISVDPEHDTPEVLTAYAQKRGLDLSNWSLLTGDKQTVHRLASEGMHFLLEEQPENMLPLPDGTTMANIAHPSKLILVGPDRRVLGLYDYPIPEDLDRLVEDARRAARAAGLSRGG